MKFLILLLIISCSSIDKSKGTDFHVHVGFPSDNTGDDMTFDASRSLVAIRSIDINRALIISRGYQRHRKKDEVVKENNYVLKMQQEKPDNFIGACGISVTHSWAFEELKRCKAIGFRVIKLHFMSDKVDLLKKNKNTKKILEFINENKMNVLVHAAYPKARSNQSLELLKIINKYSGIHWIIGHLFGRDFKLIAKIEHSNFIVETSVLPLWMKREKDKKILLEFMREIGIKKFVFGSDWPVIHPAEQLKALKGLGLSNSEINKIIYTDFKI